jgi:hypothetical protein
MLRQDYDFQRVPEYCRFLMEEWQHKAAFVVQFRPETNIEAGQFEGRVEHFTSTKATRFHSLDELLMFITRILSEVRNSDPK